MPSASRRSSWAVTWRWPRSASHPRSRHYLLKSGVNAREAADLHHFRIYLGKGGCHEAFARSVYASGTGKMSRAFASIDNTVKLRLGR